MVSFDKKELGQISSGLYVAKEDHKDLIEAHAHCDSSYNKDRKGWNKNIKEWQRLINKIKGMRPGGGNLKGKAFEKKIHKMLSLWVSDGKRKDLFKKSTLSGGQVTMQLNKGKKKVEFEGQAGDTALACYDPLADLFLKRFLTEMKCYKKIGIEGLIYGKPNKGQCILAFWNKLRDEAWALNREPMLIFKENQRPIMIMVDYYLAAYIVPVSFDLWFDEDMAVSVFDFEYFLNKFSVKRIEKM